MLTPSVRTPAGRTLLAAGALAVLALVPTLARADDRTPRVPVVVVGGEAEVRATPDRAFVTIAVESRNKDPKAAQKQNATIMAAVNEKVRGAGVAAEAIRTLAYDLQLEFDWDKGKRIPRGYLARNQIEVRLDDVERVGEVIDLAIGAGANDVTGVRFDLKDRGAVEREALRQAVADAKSRADAAAAGAGIQLAGIERIEQQVDFAPMPKAYAMEMRAAAADQAAPSTTISAGEITVNARVTLSARIAGGAAAGSPAQGAGIAP
jgi:uncharacterized protein YggE